MKSIRITPSWACCWKVLIQYAMREDDSCAYRYYSGCTSPMREFGSFLLCIETGNLWSVVSKAQTALHLTALTEPHCKANRHFKQTRGKGISLPFQQSSLHYWGFSPTGILFLWDKFKLFLKVLTMKTPLVWVKVGRIFNQNSVFCLLRRFVRNLLLPPLALFQIKKPAWNMLGDPIRKILNHKNF